MSRYFVLAYRRSAGRLIEPVFQADAIGAAAEQRLAWEQKYASAAGDVEVAVLTAPTLADLHKTHARYFKSMTALMG